MKLKSKTLEKHTDTEIHTLIAWGITRINVIEQERDEIKADIKKWRKILSERKKKKPRQRYLKLR